MLIIDGWTIRATLPSAAACRKASAAFTCACKQQDDSNTVRGHRTYVGDRKGSQYACESNVSFPYTGHATTSERRLMAAEAAPRAPAAHLVPRPKPGREPVSTMHDR